eukprot:gene25735-31081_t
MRGAIPSGLSISLKELKIAKLHRRVRLNPCSAELEAYINALADFGESKMPLHVAKALADCTEQQAATAGPRAPNPSFQLTRFISRK